MITEAGLHEKVAALVYIAAFAPDKGESVNTLLAGFPADAPQPPILPPKDGFLFLDREKFPASFAGDLPAGQAAFMADSQVPWGVNALSGTITEASWRIKPSWYLIASDDRMILPPAQRAMSERAGLHRDRGSRQPLHLPVPVGGGSRPHHSGCDRNPRVSRQAATRLTQIRPCRATARRPAGTSLGRQSPPRPGQGQPGS